MDDGDLIALLTGIVLSADASPNVPAALEVAEEIFNAVVERGYTTAGKTADERAAMRENDFFIQRRALGLGSSMGGGK